MAASLNPSGGGPMPVLFLSLFLSCFSFAQTRDQVPDLPPNFCYEGCTDTMKKLLSDFENVGTLPSSKPAVYSGECNHLSSSYNPDDVHYAVVFLDQKKTGWNFSTIFSFFADHNEFANWSVITSRNEMSPYWNEHGDILVGTNAARTIVKYENGAPAYVYWMRQNPKTNDLLYITFAGASMKSFCRLKKNEH
jgi:hypothetical protein